ncbi:MAG: diguanylate cyclase domain-containing protein [Alphaproteobacteria bacterium]
MKILILDHEDVTAEMLRGRIADSNHDVRVEASKDVVFSPDFDADFDVIFVDPAPLMEVKPLIAKLRRKMSRYVYVVLLGQDLRIKDALKGGANTVLVKPFAADAHVGILKQAEFLLGLAARIGDASEDFPSAGGVISKSAFNQLFLSALERSDRYGENSFVVFININNYKELRSLDGAYVADFSAAKLSRQLVKIRRQSDIIAQSAKNEFALLLLRPEKEDEPVQAAARFAEDLSQAVQIASGGPSAVDISIRLVAIPSGEVRVEHAFSLNPPQAI